MQIATLRYQVNPKDKVISDARARLRYRQTLAITNPQKKPKQRQSLASKLSAHTNGAFPPIKKNSQHRNSIRINGSSLASSKIGEIYPSSLRHASRPPSRRSSKSEYRDGRSGSISPSVSSRPPSKLSRLKFGHPIKIRPPEFYGPNKTETELRLREESFINDSIRSATQSRRSSIIPHYEALDDPYLRRFFQSPFVLDVVRKTLNIEHKNSYKQDERSTKLSNTSQRSITNDPYDNRNDDYLRIVSKSSSGYAKLNGYDCIPSYSPARHRRRLPRRSSTGTGDSTTSSPQRTNTNDSRLNHLTTQDKRRESTNILIRNFPTNNSNQLQKQQKKKTYISEKSKQLKPNTTSSALKHLVQHSVEGTTSNVDNSSTTKTNGNAPEQKNESAVSTTVSQD